MKRFISYACLVFSLLVYLNGFLPLKYSDFKFSNNDSLPVTLKCSHLLNNQTTNSYMPLVNKTILVLIDALRSDFICMSHSNCNFTMPKIEDLLKAKKGIAFINKTPSPTVTLPRIKAILTGKTTNYIDTIYNFNAYSLKDDNILYQAKLYDKKINFYGDDTWIKLFPNTFQRFDGTSSFFVSDYSEVDYNVTRHINKELNTRDWDILILHYLGVDHIGHSLTPSSSIMQQKLLEMDNVVYQLYSFFHSINETALVVVMGDHGMTPQGNHGGPSQWETLTPLIFLPTFQIKSRPTINISQFVHQNDIAPTLATLLGLPIPYDSTGSIIPVAQILNSPNHQLYIFYYNALHLCKKVSSNLCNEYFSEAFDLYEQYADKCNEVLLPMALLKFSEGLTKARDYFINDNTEYNVFEMVLGIIATAQTIIVIFFSFYQTYFSAFVLCFFVFGASFIIGLSKKCIVIITLFITALLYIVVLKKFKEISWPLHLKWVYISIFVNIVTLASSSFIEEEHLVWYHLTTTTLFLAFFSTYSYQIIIVLFLFHLFTFWNATGYQNSSLYDIADWLNDNNTFLNLFLAFNYIVMIILLSGFCYTIYQKLCTILTLSLIMIDKCLLVDLKYFFYLATILLFSVRAPKINFWILWVIYLFRIVNIPLITGHLLIFYLVKDHISPFFFWQIGMCLFFQQGNSNSISSLDVGGAYKGLFSYNPILVAFQLASLTYAGPVMWLLLLDSTDRFKNFETLLVVARSSTNLFYLMIAILNRYHLFIWSVFAPKLLYECTHTLIVILVISTIAILNNLNVYYKKLFNRSNYKKIKDSRWQSLKIKT